MASPHQSMKNLHSIHLRTSDVPQPPALTPREIHERRLRQRGVAVTPRKAVIA